MENEVLKIVASQGVFAALFCYLLFYVLKENSKREGKYQDIISNLTDKFQVIEGGLKDVKGDVEDIKENIRR